MDNKKWLVGLCVIITIIGSVIFFRSMKFRKVNYVISGVSYIGMHNHIGQNKFIIGDSFPAFFSLLEYWNPGKNDFSKVSTLFSSENGLITEKVVTDLFNKAGYVARSVHLENNELGKYLNSEMKTPLLVFLPITANQPKEDLYFPAMIIIGINELENKIIAHDFWLGNNYEISFAELDQRWKIRMPDERKNYIVVQPQDFKGSLAGINTRKIEAYPRRTVTMEKTEEMIKNYAIGFGLSIKNINSQSLDYFLNVEKNINFEKYLPPFFKVATYSKLGNLYLKENNLMLATIYAQKAIDVDHDIDKPFNDWPGLETYYVASGGIGGELSDPWVLMGDVSLENKEYQKAKDAYTRALKILPSRPGKLEIENKLKMIETALSQAK